MKRHRKDFKEIELSRLGFPSTRLCSSTLSSYQFSLNTNTFDFKSVFIIRALEIRSVKSRGVFTDLRRGLVDRKL